MTDTIDSKNINSENNINNINNNELTDSNYSITKEEEEQSLKNSIENVNININDIDDGDNSRYLKKRNKKQIEKEKGLHRFYKPPHFIRDKRTQRTISFVWGVLTILISGTLYGFSVISNEVRDRLDYSQTDIGLAISLGDVGIYIGLTVGYFFDLFGPFYTSLLATVLYVIGYLGVWAILKGAILNNVYLLSFFLFLVGQASHATFTSAIVPNVHNYTIKHRGKIGGVLVGMFALSSGVFGIIYKSTFKKHNNVEGYLLFLAILLSSVALISAFIVRVVKVEGVEEPELEDDSDEENKDEKLKNSQFNQSSEDLTINGSTSITNTNNNNNNSGDSGIDEENGTSSGSGSVNKSGSDLNSSSDSHAIHDDISMQKKGGKLKTLLNNITNNNKNILNSSSYKLLNKIEDFDEVAATGADSEVERNPNYLDGRRDISGLKLLKQWEFWLMWVIYFFAAGTSLMYLNNIAVMAQALDKPSSMHSDLVIIFACSNLTGRVGNGLLSDIISKKYSRFWCVVLSSLILSLTHLVIAFDLETLFYPATIITGIGYGGMVSIMVSLTSLRFGPRRFGINFGFLAISSASASLIFNTLSSKIYDDLSEHGKKCRGTHCFRTSFILSFVFNLACIFVGMFVIYKLRRNQLRK
ncbi:hypothetical protein RB653_000091 [Dictyostelium firmibasis]|uniref:Nodulin-like domain-containing protein n=1 Tax=Dictyostelium firmibasis TaxID=79012 RepID=A0AAN7U5I5_9MYCE